MGRTSTIKPATAPVVLPAALLVVMWSSGFIGAELGTREAPAATLLAWRYLVAAMILCAVWSVRRERVSRLALARQVVIGVLCQVAYLGFIVSGVGLGTPVGTTALIASLQPLVVAVLAVLFLHERTHRLQIFGLATGIVGVGLVVGGDLSGTTAPLWAYVLPVAGMLSLAFGTLLQQHWQPRETVVTAITIQSVTAAVFFFALAAAQGNVAPPATSAFWAAVAWVVILSSFGGYGAYTFVARTQGATRVSTLLYLTPPTTMLWAALMFGDKVTLLGLLGLAVCAVGVVAALQPGRPPVVSTLPR